jgi:hypothetical protein
MLMRSSMPISHGGSFWKSDDEAPLQLATHDHVTEMATGASPAGAVVGTAHARDATGEAAEGTFGLTSLSSGASIDPA